MLNNTDKIICIGDSLTFGYGIHRNKSWTYLLKENLQLNIINKGINGDTSIGILSRFFNDVLIVKPKICIIMCGTNDILSRRSVNSIVDNLNIMIKDCLSNDITPIVLSPPIILKSLAERLWDKHLNYIDINNKLNLLNNQLHELCKISNVSFISIYNLIEENNIYFSDGVHLSECGNYLIFNKIKDSLSTYKTHTM